MSSEHLTLPWEQAAWHAEATAWIDESVRALGHHLTGAPEYVRRGSLSCVLRVPTTRGDVFFKACAAQPLFADEPSLLQCLARLVLDHVPVMLAINTERRWMLQESAGAVISEEPPIERKVEILATLSAVQRTIVPHVETLIKLDIAARRPQRLIGQIEPLLEDELAVHQLTWEEVGFLRRATQRILDLCQQVDDSAVPPTLIHGDLHVENVAICDDRLVFLDWSEACIAHPFMDPFMAFNEDDAARHHMLRDAYLEEWTAFEPKARLLELWTCCGVVHAMHHAVSYVTILEATVPQFRAELEAAPAFLLRKAIKYLRDG